MVFYKLSNQVMATVFSKIEYKNYIVARLSMVLKMKVIDFLINENEKLAILKGKFKPRKIIKTTILYIC